MLTDAPVVAVSLKMYLGHNRGTRWISDVAEHASAHRGLARREAQLVILPSFLQVPFAVDAFADTPVQVGAQDCAADDEGPYTGEVSPAELAEIGVSVVEVGHAERRRLFHEDDTLIAAKTSAALRNGLTPLICVGETTRGNAELAANVVLSQFAALLNSAPAGPVIIAYEPVWAIGQAEPAPWQHIQTVTDALRAAAMADPDRAESSIIYGGSAGPGILTTAAGALDGLFLGRSAHNVATLFEVVDEACALGATRSTATTEPTDTTRRQS